MFREIEQGKNTQVGEMMRALRNDLGENDMMTYLTMVANRLMEMHRVLKPAGSLYLHCDPAASHYLKIVLDGVAQRHRAPTSARPFVRRAEFQEGESGGEEFEAEGVARGIACHGHRPCGHREGAVPTLLATRQRYQRNNLIHPDPSRPNSTPAFFERQIKCQDRIPIW